MARATGKATKKRRKRRRVASADPFTQLFDAKRWRSVPPLYFAASDLLNRDLLDFPFERDLLLPEMVCLQLEAIMRFQITRWSYPPKDVLTKFFMNAGLLNGEHLSRHHAEVMATFVRSSMTGGRPRKKRPAWGPSIPLSGPPCDDTPVASAPVDKPADPEKS